MCYTLDKYVLYFVLYFEDKYCYLCCIICALLLCPFEDHVTDDLLAFLHAGTIISIGMMQTISLEWMEKCIWSEQAPGDALP